MADFARFGLAIVGGVAGFFIGNPYLGFALGATVGGLLFPQQLAGQSVQGPRLSDLRVQSSSYGRGIPLAYGTLRLAGNLIWSTKIKETAASTTQEIGGKGSPPTQEVTTTTYSYSVSCAVALCEGEIAGIRKIWANGELIYNVGSGADYETYIVSKARSKAVRVYTGSETQDPDPLILALEGIAPAYRGTAYVVFDTLQLARFGNRMPNFEFEVVSAGSNAPSVAYIDGQSDFGLYVNAGVAPDGNLLIWWATVDTGSDYASRMALVNPFTSQIIREYRPYDLATDIYPGTERPAINARGDIIFQARFFDSGPYVWPAGGVPTEVAVSTVTRMYADENGDFIFGARVATSGSNQYSLLRVAAGTTQVQTIRGFGLLATRDVALGWDGYAYVARSDNTAAGGLEKIRLADGVPVASWTGVSGIRSVCPAGDGSVWYWDGQRLFRIAPDFGSQAEIFDHGSSFTGNTAVRIERDWETGDILLCYISNYRRYSPAGTLLRHETSIRAFAAVTDPRFPERIYLVNQVSASGGVNRFIAVDRKDNVTPGAVGLDDVIGALCARAGLEAGDIDVSALTDEVRGYVVAQPMRAAEAIGPLLTGFLCDAVESAGKIKFVARGAAAVATIAEADMGAHLADSEPPEPQTESRIQESDLPREIALTYFDADADYQPSTQYARRLVSASVNDQQLQLALVLTAAEARQVAEALLYEAWIARRTHELAVSTKHSRLEPGDAVDLALPGDTLAARIVHKEEGQGLVRLRTVGYDASVYTQAAAGAGAPAGQDSLSALGATNLLLLDTALLREQDDTYGLYTVAGGIGASTEWPGGKLFKSADNVGFADTGVAWPLGGAIGYATTRIIEFFGGNTFDERGGVTVSLLSGSLASTTEGNVLNGANAALLGQEVIQFKTATLVDANTYQLTGLLRGRLGTEWAMRRHRIGEPFALLDADTVRRLDAPSGDVGVVRWYKGVTFGTEIEAAAAQPLTLRARCLLPLPPVEVGGGRNASSDVLIAWKRRARKSAGWSDYIDVPLDEPTESYEVEVFAGGTKSITGISQEPDGVISSTAHGYIVGDVIYITGVGGMSAMNDRAFTVASVPNANSYTVGEDTTGYVAYSGGGTTRKRGRTIAAGSASATYTAAEQTTDFGGTQATVYAAVYQLSSRVGRGYHGVGVI